MPFARIISSQHGGAEDQLTQQLQAAGYQVELVTPAEDRSSFADLEIELDAVPADQALEAAFRMARAGADVFIAPGALAGPGEAAAQAERERLEREQMAREAAAERQRQQEERRREAELEAVLLRASQEQERQRLAAIEAHRRAAAQQALAPVAAPPAAVQPVARRVSPARRVAFSRQQQWQRAVFFASLIALAVMLGFAAAMNLRPAQPIPTKMLQNGAQQNVPFGAASITPSTTSAPPRAAAPAPKPAPRPSAARPKPVRPAPRARHSRNNFQDEVVVRHYTASPAPRAQSQASVRRYSDEN